MGPAALLGLFSGEVGTEEPSLHTSAQAGGREGSETPEVRREPGREEEGGRVRPRERVEGRVEERKERGRERLGALPAVLQAKGFIEHNMPRNKRE